MKFKERFLKCKTFLDPWLEFLEQEVLKHYPKSLPLMVEEWVDELEESSIEDLLEFVNNRITSSKNENLNSFLSEISELTLFDAPKIQPQPLAQNLKRRVDKKKQHELERMRHLANEFENVETVIDIGGGAGHLSTALVNCENRKSFCLDRNETFQKQGIDRLSQWDKSNLEKVEFIQCDFEPNFTNSAVDQSLNRLVVGLHGCGDLTTNTIRYYKQSDAKSLLSVGCCYQNLNGQYNISKLGESEGIKFSKNALHLAARCHVLYNESDMKRKIMVRNYRYALHFYLLNKENQAFKAIGKTSLKDYEFPFSDYAHKYGDLSSIDPKELNRFYEDKSTQRLIKRTIVADIIRELLGRVVETYVVLDRALFLQDAGHKVQVVEAFDRGLSPRNLLIISEKKAV